MDSFSLKFGAAESVLFTEKRGPLEMIYTAQIAVMAIVTEYDTDLYESSGDVAGTVRRNASDIIKKAIYERPEGTSVIDDEDHRMLAEQIGKQLEKYKIKAEIKDVIFFANESPENAAENLNKLVNDRKKTKGSRLEELKRSEPPHGELISISHSSSSSGMMMNSNAHYSDSICKKDGVWTLTSVSMPAFQNETVTVYKIGEEVVKQIEETVKREGLAAFDGLRYKDPYPVYDYSSSSGISMTFDDSSVGGSPRVYKSLDVAALRQCGLDDTVSELCQLISSGGENKEIISFEEKQRTGMDLMMGMMGMTPGGNNNSNTENKTPAPKPVPVKDPPAGAWTCKTCGYNANLGKFCSECGERRGE
ncbi:MAG: hypothetical protein J5585_07095 [Clostridia bacterium]|nr:hypothetical protein [Clostridia bacterium]